MDMQCKESEVCGTSAHGHGGPGEPPSREDDDDLEDDEVPWC